MSQNLARPAAAWACHELAGVQLPDRRLVKRAQILMTQFGERPMASIPQACGDWGGAKAAYRFFDNPAVAPADLLAAHTRATVGRMQGQAVVLAVQDTTALNYSRHPRTEGLGPIGNNPDKTVGLLLHSTLAVTTTGAPLGFLTAAVTARDARQFGSSRQAQKRNGQPLAEKESQRWLASLTACQTLAAACPATRIINVADREGDIYELFAQALAPGPGRRVDVLVRSQHNRQLAGAGARLWPLLNRQPRAGQLRVQTPRQPGAAPRQAVLSLRFTGARVQAPGLKAGQPALELWAVEAREAHPPKGRAPIHWRLLTTLPVTGLDAAVEKVRWYAQRWQIEVFHRVLKSGCQVEARQLAASDRLQRALMLDLMVAWHLMHLTHAAREQPDAPVQGLLDHTEWLLLWRHFNPQLPLPAQPPPTRQAVRWLGQLGGFLARKSDGEPGPTVLWRGWQRLQDMAHTWKLSLNCG